MPATMTSKYKCFLFRPLPIPTSRTRAKFSGRWNKLKMQGGWSSWCGRPRKVTRITFGARLLMAIRWDSLWTHPKARLADSCSSRTWGKTFSQRWISKRTPWKNPWKKASQHTSPYSSSSTSATWSHSTSTKSSPNASRSTWTATSSPLAS
jgi:hypothetical protein